MFPLKIRSGLAVVLASVVGVLLVLHGCQEPPDEMQSSTAVASAAGQFALTITGTGSGNGLVNSTPAGINCTITAGRISTSGCSANFNSGTIVNLSGTATQTSHSFVGWSGPCKGRGVCTLSMTAARTASARFLKGPFVVTVTGTGGGGSGTVASQDGLAPSIACVITAGVAASSGCSATYPANTSLRLTATPASGSSLIGWSAPCQNSGTGACQFDVIQPRTITPSLSLSQTLTVTGSGDGAGTVRSQTGLAPAVDCTITAGATSATGCSANYQSAVAVTLTARPDAGSAFTGWTGACSGTGSCQVTIAQTAEVGAAFATTGSSGTAVEGRWEPVFSTPVVAVHLHLLPTGKVLLWGAAGESQVWDPVTGGFTEFATPYRLFCSGHTYLPDGRLLVSGGHISNGHGLPLSAIFDPASNSWSTTGTMARGRWYPTTTTLPNGEILTLSGHDEGGSMVLTPEIWDGGSWRQLTSASNVDLPYYPRMFVAPNGRVFMAGEKQGTRYLSVTGTGQWTTVGSRKGGNRSYGSAVMYAPGKIIYVGGGDPPKSSAEVIDLNQAAPAWRVVAPMSFARRQMNATLLADGQVLVTNGTSGPGFNDESSPVRYAELWNPTTERWTTLSAEAEGRMYHSTTILLPDGRVLSSGSGDGSGATNHRTAQIFTPPYLFKPDGTLADRPTISSAPARLSYRQSFTVETPDAGSIVRATLIRLSSVTHAFNESQLIYPLELTPAGATTLAATAPPDGITAPPGPYMIFLIDANGVPSVGSMVAVGP